MTEHIIERFKKFQKATGQFVDLDIGEVEFEKSELSERVDFLNSKRKPIKKGLRKKGKYPYYGASGITDYVDGYIFDEQLLLVSEDGENLKSRNNDIAFIVNGKFWVNNHAHILSPKEDVYIKYLTYAMNSNSLKGAINVEMIPKLNLKNLKRVKINFPKDLNKKYPSLTIQKAIVAFIEFYQKKNDRKLEILGRMEEKVKELEQIIVPLFFKKDEAVAKRFDQFCEKKGIDLRLKEIGFSFETVENFFGLVRRGASPRPIKKYIVSSSYEGEKYRWLKISDVTSSNMYLNSTKQFINAEGKNKSVLGKKGDLLITNSMTVGIPIILNVDTCFHDGFIYLGINEKAEIKADKKYLYYFFIGFRHRLISRSKKGIVNNLNLDIIRSVKLPMPFCENFSSEELQKVITDWIEYYFLEKNNLNTTINILKSLITQHTQLIIHQTFTQKK